MEGETTVVTSVQFSDFSVWGLINLLAVLLLSLLAANFLKKTIRFLRNSLIPTSVLGGALVLIAAVIYKAITGNVMLDTEFFGGKGMNAAEIITYHSLAIGFIATTFKPGQAKLGKTRTREIFNTGVTTVSSYLLQAVLGLGLTILWGMFVQPGFFQAAGALLPFGYGQGTGQALNYGGIYEADYAFYGGKSFGLTIAAFGFLSAAIGGVIYLNILRKKGRFIPVEDPKAEVFRSEDVQKPDEIPMNGSIDKMTIQLGLVAMAYIITYLIIFFLAKLVPSLSSVLYGFNFLIGVLIGSAINAIMGFLKKKGVIQKEYVNPFLMKRISCFFFDLMIVAGIAAIRIDMVKDYWAILLVLGIVGMLSTFFYNRWIAHKLFPKYEEEQFLVMYGMLTGTASTGTVLLRELDPDFVTPAADNLVYQNFPAIVFGFPLMLLGSFAPKNPPVCLLLLTVFFLVMNIILWRSFLFKSKKKKYAQEAAEEAALAAAAAAEGGNEAP